MPCQHPLHIWAGANDILAVADKAGSGTVNIHAFESVAAGAVTNLEIDILEQVGANGAQYIVWPNLPDLSDTPHAAGDPFNLNVNLSNWGNYVDPGWSASVQKAVADAVQTFNTDWASAIQSIRSTSPGLTIYPLDVNSLFEGLLNKTYPGLPQDSTLRLKRRT